jgi:hypothetical protein
MSGPKPLPTHQGEQILQQTTVDGEFNILFADLLFI